jgi:hypothetical protein
VESHDAHAVLLADGHHPVCLRHDRARRQGSATGAARGAQANAGEAGARATSGHRRQRALRGDGDIVYKHARKLDSEGIVSKRLGSLCRSGRSSPSRADRHHSGGSDEQCSRDHERRSGAR